jgi:acyl-CoA synthetase (AMP-forming)/AMP-acid ligase II
MVITPAPRGANPFDDAGVQPDSNGVRRYPNLHKSLVEMLSDSVQSDPSAEALVEVGGPRLSYAELWEGAARVAGGLRKAGIRPGDRVAIRLPNSIGWVLAFFGGLMAGAVVVPVNTRLTEAEAGYIIGTRAVRTSSRPALPFQTAVRWHTTARSGRTSLPSSIPAALPGSPRARCTPTRTCSRTWRLCSG